MATFPQNDRYIMEWLQIKVYRENTHHISSTPHDTHVNFFLFHRLGSLFDMNEMVTKCYDLNSTLPNQLC